MRQREMKLRYGMNPHQTDATANFGDVPIRVVNGSPGYINLLDALNAWPLVRELEEATGLPAAASFKHVSPAGAAVGPNPDTPVADVYRRARDTDPGASFGDFAALSRPIDVSTAKILRAEVSDGVIAPGVDPHALEILKKKKGGRYLVLTIDRDYRPPVRESRMVYGVTLTQSYDDAPIGPELLSTIVAGEGPLPDDAKRDMLVAMVVLKYTQSNSVCLVRDGATIAVGAGQQSRILCTDLVARKAHGWWMRRHPVAEALRFKPGTSRVDRRTAVDLVLADQRTEESESRLTELVEEVPPPIAAAERARWIEQLTDTTLGSDGFFPFRDNIERAAEAGVRWVVQPGGSLRDDEIVEAAREHKMVMVATGRRLFHH